jgi:hypothetical protein
MQIVSMEGFHLKRGLNPKTETRQAGTLHGGEPGEWRISQLTSNRRKNWCMFTD